MREMDINKVIAEAAVALQEAKEEIERLKGELEDAERRIQFLEVMVA
jgi:vacuolar-type H+-ATPase subunit D/Vma8